MSLSWTYLTKSFVLMRYRDVLAVSLVGTYFFSNYIQYQTHKADKEAIMDRFYTDDESDIEYRELYNKTDAAVRR